MESEPSPERAQAMLQLPAARRYACFLQRVVESGEVWGLDAEGWALAMDEEGGDVLPLWPASEFAGLCAKRLWEGFVPKPLALDELVALVLPQLEAEGLSLGIFFTPEGQGFPVSASQLLDDLRIARGLPA
ncbi:DUF2750 domain-containing protein [Myxococcaceae bacterium GXIMD 01537]